MCDEKVKNCISYARSSLVEGDEGSFNPQVMNCLLNDKIKKDSTYTINEKSFICLAKKNHRNSKNKNCNNNNTKTKVL